MSILGKIKEFIELLLIKYLVSRESLLLLIYYYYMKLLSLYKYTLADILRLGSSDNIDCNKFIPSSHNLLLLLLLLLL